MQIFDILSLTIPYTKITLANIMWALLTLIVGYIIIIVFLDAFKRSLSRAGIPPLAAGIITRLTSILLYVALLLAVVSALGFNTSSIILGLSAVIGLILGFGLQDTINNLAAGVWITIVRAFKKGDFVSVAGYTGTIEDVGVLSTKMKLPSGEIALIPNRNVWGQPIVNYSAADKRRFEFTVGVAYGTDLDKAIKVALNALKEIPEILSDPAPQVLVWELADSSINLQIRAWAEKENFLTARVKAIQKVYEALSEAGIEIPFPQLEVTLKKGEPSQ